MIQKLRKSIPVLLPVVAGILILGLILSRVISPGSSSPPEPEITISAFDAADNTGTTAKVCGTVASADYLPEIGGQPTFLNFEQPHPNQVFTAVIWGRHRQLWRTPPEQAYLNRDICVIGEIRMHEDTPQIEVEFREQISLR